MGCGTTPVKKVSSSDGPELLSADLFVERDGKAYKIKSDMTVVSSRAIRLDLRTTLDLPLASIVLTDKKIEYALYRDKKYYTGRPGPHALDPLFPLAVDVRTLVEILKEHPVTGAQCQSDDVGPTSCQGQTGSTAYVVAWSKRKNSGPLAGRASKVVLEIPDRHVSLRFYLNDLQQDVPNAGRLLALQVPPGFATLSTP